MEQIQCVAYLRYSSENQQETSIEYQDAAIMQYCERNHLIMINKYIDRAQSGTTSKRHAFRQMLSDAKSQPGWSQILVYNFSRFSRNVIDSITYSSELLSYGITLVSITEGSIVNATPGETLLRNVTFAINQYTSDQTAVQSLLGQKAQARKSKHCGGIPPLGYDLDAEGKLIINEREAEVVRKIFQMYLDGVSYQQMAKTLNQSGYQTKTGRPFQKNSFYEILKREKYAGIFTWNKSSPKFRRSSTQNGFSRNSHRLKPREEQVRIEGGCPAIISKVQFEAVQRQVETRSRGRSLVKSRKHYTLSGLGVLKCGICGRAMVGISRVSHEKSYTTYGCPNHKSGCPTKEIKTQFLDQMIVKAVTATRFQEKWIDFINQELQPYFLEEELIKSRASLEHKIQNLLLSLENHPSAAISERLALLEKERERVDQKIQAATSKAFLVSPANFKKTRRELYHFLLTSPSPEARALLKDSIKEILITDDTVKFTLQIS